MTNKIKVLILVPPSKYSKNVARDLVYGCWCKGKRIAGVKFPPISLALAATVLRESGLSVSLVDAAGEGLNLEEVRQLSKDFDFCVILTSSMTLNEDADFLAELKKINPKLKTIVFGGHATAEPRSTLTRKGIDIVVRREPEYILRDLLLAFANNQDWRIVKGIAFMDGVSYVENDFYPLIENLDDLPIPDRGLFSDKIHYFNPSIKRMPYTTMFTSRGCPGLCTFCSSPTFYGRLLRFMSAGRVLEEIRECVKLGYREIFFRDEIFTASQSRVIEICKGIIDEKMDLTWVCSSRINTIDKEMMLTMKRAGCHLLRFGVESGVQELLNNVKKGTTVDNVRDVFKWAREVGVDTHAHMMIGMPGETRETLKMTMNFIKEIEPTTVTFGILTPYAGTEIFEELRKHHPEISDGTEMDISKLHTSAFYNEYFTKLSAQDLQKYIRQVYRLFYLRPSYILKQLFKVKSKDELKRLILAGLNVFRFVFNKDS